MPSPQPFWCVQKTRLSTELLFFRWGKEDLCETHPCSTCTGKLSLPWTGMWNRRRHIQALMGRSSKGLQTNILGAASSKYLSAKAESSLQVCATYIRVLQALSHLHGAPYSKPYPSTVLSRQTFGGSSAHLEMSMVSQYTQRVSGEPAAHNRSLLSTPAPVLAPLPTHLTGQMKQRPGRESWSHLCGSHAKLQILGLV